MEIDKEADAKLCELAVKIGEIQAILGELERGYPREQKVDLVFQEERDKLKAKVQYWIEKEDFEKVVHYLHHHELLPPVDPEKRLDVPRYIYDHCQEWPIEVVRDISALWVVEG